jgi:hypothetical protein
MAAMSEMMLLGCVAPAGTGFVSLTVIGMTLSLAQALRRAIRIGQCAKLQLPGNPPN